MVGVCALLYTCLLCFWCIPLIEESPLCVPTALNRCGPWQTKTEPSWPRGQRIDGPTWEIDVEAAKHITNLGGVETDANGCLGPFLSQCIPFAGMFLL